MKEKETFKNKLIVHLFYHLLAFSIILLIFGIFVFSIIKNIVYQTVDNELIENVRILEDLKAEQENILLLPEISNREDIKKFLTQEIDGYKDYIINRMIKNPKIVVVLRNRNGDILNQSYLGRLLDYQDEIDISGKKFNEIYNLKIANNYNYRAIICEYDEINEENDRIVQLLINVDSEHELMENLKAIIFSSVLLGIILSVIASYILSKHTLKPLHDNIKNQMEFIQNASHELRTPLTIIQAKQELLLKEPNAKIMDKSEDILLTLNETKRLAKLTKDLMILSRADNKTLNLQKEKVNIDEFIEGLISPYKEIAELDGKIFNTNYGCGIEVNIDTNRIYQLMVILLDNAIKYTETGDLIEIYTSIKDNKCIIEVKDTGIGVSDEGLSRIFERFYREDDARNRETGGSGLGLSIASFIVKAHGGTIKATHNSPKGTIFTVRFPK